MIEQGIFIFFLMVRVSFANRIAADGIEGTYTTFYASVNNTGRKITDSTFVLISDLVNFDTCVVLGWVFAAG